MKATGDDALDSQVARMEQKELSLIQQLKNTQASAISSLLQILCPALRRHKLIFVIHVILRLAE